MVNKGKPHPAVLSESLGPLRWIWSYLTWTSSSVIVLKLPPGNVLTRVCPSICLSTVGVPISHNALQHFPECHGTYTRGVPCQGGTLPGPVGGYPGQVLPLARSGQGGYPAWGVPWSGTPPGQDGGGYPGRTTEGVLNTRWVVCLLRSRRRTFLLSSSLKGRWEIWTKCRIFPQSLHKVVQFQVYSLFVSRSPIKWWLDLLRYLHSVRLHLEDDTTQHKAKPDMRNSWYVCTISNHCCIWGSPSCQGVSRCSRICCFVNLAALD